MDLIAELDGPRMVHMHVVRDCFNILHTHDRVSMCAGIIKRNANAGTVEYFWGKTKVEKTDLEREHFDRFWRDQGNRAIDWIYCAGLIPLTFEEIFYENGERDQVPRVLSPEEGRIWICRQASGPPIYKWSGEKNLLQGMQFDERVIVLSGFGYDPEITGVIQSIIGTLLIRINAEAGLIDTSCLANRIRANPPYIHQHEASQELAPGSNTSSTAYAMTQDKLFNDAWREQQRAYEFDAQRKEEAIAIRALFKKRAAEKSASSQVYTYPWDGNVHKVPYGLKYVAAPVPQGPEELTQQLLMIDERICNRMGIPLSMISSTNKMVATDDSVNEQFVETIGFWKDVLSRFYTVCEIIIHAEKDARDILAHFLTENQKNVVTEYDLFQLQRNTEVRVHCPMPQFLTMEQLHFCLQNNVITREEFILHMRKKARFPDPTPAQIQELLATAEEQYDRENPPPEKPTKE